MADQAKTSAFAGIQRCTQHKDGELFELDLRLAEYYTEHLQLILELNPLRAQLRDGEETASSAPEP